MQGEPQISPLRCAPVEMTIHLGKGSKRSQENLPSRPERSVVERSAVPSRLSRCRGKFRQVCLRSSSGATVLGYFQKCMMGPALFQERLKVELTPKLQYSWIACGGDLTGCTGVRSRKLRSRCGRGQAVVDRAPLCMVEDVVGLEP
jgi:hypothetical protein